LSQKAGGRTLGWLLLLAVAVLFSFFFFHFLLFLLNRRKTHFVVKMNNEMKLKFT